MCQLQAKHHGKAERLEEDQALQAIDGLVRRVAQSDRKSLDPVVFLIEFDAVNAPLTLVVLELLFEVFP